MYFDYFVVGLTLLVGRVRGSIESGDELKCDFEGAATCVGWRNDSLSLPGERWIITNSVLVDVWHSIPRPFGGRNFAFVTKDSAKPKQVSRIVSDVIPCLVAPGYLLFYYWKNSFLSSFVQGGTPTLTVGVREPDSSSMKQVGEVPASNEWGWRYQAVEIPASDKPFQIVFEATLANTFDGIGLDDIDFQGYLNDKFCGLSESQKVELLSSGLPQQRATTSSNDDDAETPNVESSPLRQARPSKSSEKRRSKSTQRPTAHEDEKFHDEDEPSTASFGSEREDGIDVALLPTLRPIGAPARTTTARSRAAAASKLAVRHQSDNLCEAVTCNFEGDSCLYEGTDSTIGAWVIKQGKLGNPVTGIASAAQGSYYAAAYSNITSSTQVLRTPPFKTQKATLLRFSYYFANAESGVLKICDNGVEEANCLWRIESISVFANSRRWKQAKVELNPGKHRIYIVIDNLEPNYYAGIDQVFLAQANSVKEPASCESVSDDESRR